MKKILILILFFQFLFIGNAIAETSKDYLIKQSLQFENIYVTDNLTDLGAETFFKCEEENQKLYEKIDECIAVCKECAYQDNGCWKCIESKEEKETTKNSANNTWVQKVKNWVRRIFVAVGNFFKKIAKKPKPEQKINKKKEAAIKVLAYHEAETYKIKEEPKDESVEAALFHAFKNAKDFSDLIELRALMMIYCNDIAKQDYEKEKKCNDRFMALFREKGDEFKEKLINDIDPKKGDSENFQKIIQLDSLLMAGKSATGKGVWFTLDNIKKVKKELKEKAKVWFKAALEKADLNKLIELHSLAMAYTSARGEGMGVMEGFYPLNLAQDRAEILILKKLMSLDVCTPDKKEVAEIQVLLQVEKLIADDLVYNYIKEGNLEAAYAKLYKAIIKKYPEKKKELNSPIDCKKTEENQQETKEPENENIDTIDTEEEDKFINQEIEDGNILKTEECNLEIYEKEIVGWDFIINNCEKSYEQGLTCFNHCGWLPPVYLEKIEEEVICYETENGFIDKNTIIPCHKRPEPDFGILQCINDCLKQ